MEYTDRYASTTFCPVTHDRGADDVGSRSSVFPWLSHPPRPVAAGPQRGQPTTAIACHLHCNAQTVRNAIHAFHQRGLGVLQPKSSRPHTTEAIFDDHRRQRLRALLRQSPPAFGKRTSIWTLELAAEVSFSEGITPRQGVSRPFVLP